MHIEDFAGQGASVRTLCGAFESGAPIHASLLLGPEGVGKRTLANTLAQSQGSSYQDWLIAEGM